MTPFSQLIKACGLSLKGAAMLLGLPYATLARWSCGQSDGTGKRFSKIHSSIAKLQKLRAAQDEIFGKNEKSE